MFHKRRGRMLRSARSLRKRRRAIAARAVSFSVGFVVIVLSLSILAHRDEMRIRGITVRGTALLSSAEVEEFAARRLSGKYIWLFPKSNVFLAPRRAIERGLLDAFAGLLDADASAKSFRSMEIVLRERLPFALWCGEEDGSADSCYFVDKRGVIFEKAPAYSDVPFFVLYGPASGASARAEGTYPAPLGTYFLPAEAGLGSEDAFMKITAFKDALAALAATPAALHVRDDGYEFVLESGTKIISNRESGADLGYRSLASALAADPLAGVDLDDPGNGLEYVDLRFGNRVYYKFGE